MPPRWFRPGKGSWGYWLVDDEPRSGEYLQVVIRDGRRSAINGIEEPWGKGPPPGPYVLHTYPSNRAVQIDAKTYEEAKAAALALLMLER